MDLTLAVLTVLSAGFLALGVLWAATKSEGRWTYDRIDEGDE